MQHLIRNLYAVPVPGIVTELHVINYMQDSDAGKYRVIGHVTATEISFDVERYLESWNISHVGKAFKCYTGKTEFYTCANKSFRSLLQSKELYFENPLKDAWDEACKWGHGGCTKNEHDEAAKKVVEKLIIIEKV